MASIHPKVHLPLPVGGLRPDLTDFDIPPDALRPGSYNWLLRDGSKLVTRPGFTPFAQDTGAPIPLGAISFQDRLGTGHIIHATTEKWWRFNTTTLLWQDISDPALLWDGSQNVPVTFRVFNSGSNTFLLGTNGADTPRAWDTSPTTNVFTAFTTLNFARCIAILRDRVLLGHLSGDPNAIDVSAFQDHTSGWGVNQTATLLETPGFIVAMEEINPTQVAVYKTDSIYLVTGTSGLAPFRFDIQVTNISGPINPRGVVPITASLHAVFTRNFQLFFFDGSSYVPHPASDRVRILVEQSASKEPLALAKSHAYYDRTNNELRWFYVKEGDELVGPRDTIVVNLSNDSVWREEYPIAFTMSYYGNFLFSSDELRPSILLGDADAQCYLFEGDDDDGAAIGANLETGLNHLGDPTRAKTVEEIEHYFSNPTSTQTPSISILTSEAGKDPAESSAQPITLTTTSTGPYMTGHRTAGGERITSRFIGMKITDASLTAPLEYRGSSVTVVPRGNR